jgi:iron complex transport system permease protein
VGLWAAVWRLQAPPSRAFSGTHWPIRRWWASRPAAVLTIVLGGALVGRLGPTLAPLALPAGAFVGGLLTTLLIERIATRDGQVQIATMLLAGIAINALAGALVGAMTFISDDQQLRELTFWLMGSLA